MLDVGFVTLWGSISAMIGNRFSSLSRLLLSFRDDRSGNIVVIFAILLVPLLGMVGAAIDYSRATTARQMLIAAVDSAALMAARDATKLTDAQLRTRIDDWIKANLHGVEEGSFTGANVAIDRTARTINIVADAKVKTTMTQLLGPDSVAIASSSQSVWGTNKIELALVLDNTGSMSSSGKMTALKTASKDLIKIMKDATTETDQIKISIVPFNTQVKLVANTYKDAPWLRFDLTRQVWNGSKYVPETMSKSIWTQNGQGCITDRDQSYDVSDGEASLDTTPKKYPAYWCAQTSLATVLPLTADWTALNNKIDSMTPVGNTNVTIGAVWGMATLSTALPMNEAKPAGTERLSKYMILLTDGENTQNRWGTNGSSIDVRTRLACINAKAAGIKVYTIRVIDGDRDLLKQCASQESMYYEVSNASQLSPVFQAIAKEISQVRLSM